MTKAGKVASSGAFDTRRRSSVKRLDIISDEDKFIKGVGELNTDVIIAIKVFGSEDVSGTSGWDIRRSTSHVGTT